MDYTVLDHFQELLNTDCLPSCFKFDQVVGELFWEPDLVFRSDTINHSHKLIHKAVPISDTPGGCFNLSIGWADLKLNTLVGGHIYL